MTEETSTPRGKTVTLAVPQPSSASLRPLNKASGLPGALNVGSGRPKKPLKPGRSLMDWIRLANSGEHMTSLRGQMRGVTPAELAKHNTEDDCWMAIHEQVYDVTRYMEFHPGGADELMRGAGQDATELFNEVHRWVNFSSMLSRCLVGPLVTPRATIRGRKQADHLGSPIQRARTPSPSMLPPPRPAANSADRPRWDWNEAEDSLTLILRYPEEVPQSNYATISFVDRRVKIHTTVPPHVHTFYFNLQSGLQWRDEELPIAEGKECRLKLHKTKPGSKVATVGQVTRDDWRLVKNLPLGFLKLRVISREEVTYNTLLFCLQWPEGFYFRIPLGHHVRVRIMIEGPDGTSGMELARSYTPVASSLIDPLTAEECGGRRFYLMVKIYPDGCLTPHLAESEPESLLSVSAPDGSFSPLLGGYRRARRLLLLAAGTGFTPMVRLIRAVLLNEDRALDEPLLHLRLLFFNKTEKDILWRKQLQQLREKFPERVTVTHILSNADEAWTGLRGRISAEMLKREVSEAEKEADRSTIFAAVCGPDAFTENAVDLLTSALHLSESQIHAFKG